MAKRYRLSGPLERDLQAWILASLGTEQKRCHTDRRGRSVWAGTGLYIDRQRGAIYWRANSALLPTPSGGMIRAGVKGMADIGGIVAGRSVWLEVKRPGQKQSEAQVKWQALVERAGGVYAVVCGPAEAKRVVHDVWRGVLAPPRLVVGVEEGER